MEDRFKFRCFNKHTKKHEYSFIGAINTHPFSDITMYELPELCTGLKDKNDTLIFEGDILIKGDYFHNNPYGENKVICYYSKIFNSLSFIFKSELNMLDNLDKSDNINYDKAWNGLKDNRIALANTGNRLTSPFGNITSNVEIIGNVYENPELVKAVNNEFL